MLLNQIEKAEDLQNIDKWELLQDVKKISLKELPFNFRRARKETPRRVTRSIKDDYCRVQSIIGKYSRFIKVRPKLQGMEPDELMVSWKAFKRRLYRLSPLTTRELTFTINLLFHELLEVMKAGYSIKVPRFGTFYAEHSTSLVKRKYNPRTGSVKVYNKPSDWMILHTVEPKFFPDMYSRHVLAKREHMRTPYRNYVNTTLVGTVAYWEKTRAMFLRRRQMLRSQQIDLMGFADNVLQKCRKEPVLKGKKLHLESAKISGTFLPADYVHDMYKEVQAEDESGDVELRTVRPNVQFLNELKKETVRSIFSHTRIKKRDMDILEKEGRLHEVFGDNEEALQEYLVKREEQRRREEALLRAERGEENSED